MKRDTVILMIALLCGAVAFGLIFNFLKQASLPKNQFVMSKQALKKGAILTASDIALSQPLKGISPEDFFSQIHEVIGMQIDQDLPTGKLIGRNIVKYVQKAPVPKKPVVVKTVNQSLPVPPSMRALTLGPQELENIPKELEAGNYVDVLGVVAYGTKQREVRTLIRGATVLSALKSDKEQPDAITLALPSPTVESILNASKLGKMRLVVTSEPGDGSDTLGPPPIEIIRGVTKEPKAS